MLYLFSLLLSFVLFACASYTPNVPLFVWSGDDLLSSRNEQIRSSVTTETVGHFIQSLSGGKKYVGPFSQHLTESKPELLVVFFDNHLSSEQVAHYKNLLPSLEKSMKESHSFFVPYVQEVGHSLVRSSFSAARTVQTLGGKVFFMGKDTSILKLEKGLDVSVISSFSEVLSSTQNSKTDMLCVVIEGDDTKSRMEIMEGMMKEMDDTFRAAEFYHYVALLVGTSPDLNLPSDSEMGIPEIEKRAIEQDPPTPPPVIHGANTFNTYFNGVFWELLAVLLVFWGIVYFGTMKLLELQAPDRLPTIVTKQKKKD